VPRRDGALQRFGKAKGSKRHRGKLIAAPLNATKCFPLPVTA
jgi:hypothetical protein